MPINFPNLELPTTPCMAEQCLSYHQQLVLFVFLANLRVNNGETADYLENAVKRYRNLAPAELIQMITTQFEAAEIAQATPEALKCFNCYTDRKLLEMATWLLAAGIKTLPT
jgi:hypothetical protein